MSSSKWIQVGGLTPLESKISALTTQYTHGLVFFARGGYPMATITPIQMKTSSSKTSQGSSRWLPSPTQAGSIGELKDLTIPSEVTLIATPTSRSIAHELDEAGTTHLLGSAGAHHASWLRPPVPAGIRTVQRCHTTLRHAPGRIGDRAAQVCLVSPVNPTQAALGKITECLECLTAADLSVLTKKSMDCR